MSVPPEVHVVDDCRHGNTPSDCGHPINVSLHDRITELTDVPGTWESEELRDAVEALVLAEKAAAWDEGYESGCAAADHARWSGSHDPDPPNPYLVAPADTTTPERLPR